MVESTSYVESIFIIATTSSLVIHFFWTPLNQYFKKEQS